MPRMSSSVTEINNRQGSVVAVLSDMILVRFESKGVLFRKNVMKRAFKHDEIVQFNARRATTTDKEVGDWLRQASGYEIEWLGTDIKFIKMGRTLHGEGVVLCVPDGQFMFVDWKFTPASAPKPTLINGRSNPTNVFVTRASVRPDVADMRTMFKTGDRVKYVAREQAPNERGVCWRTVIATDSYHEIAVDTPTAHCRNNFKVVPKSGSSPPAPKHSSPRTASTATVARPSPAPKQPAWTVEQPKMAPKPKKTAPPKYEVQKPPPVDGFDYFDTSLEACAARFRKFADTYREANPSCLFSKPSFEGFLKMKYLQQVADELDVIQAAQ